MNTITQISIAVVSYALLHPFAGDAAWLIVAVIWVAGVSIKEWYAGIEERARKAQAAATMQALSDIHDEMMRECGMPEMVGKSSFHKSED